MNFQIVGGIGAAKGGKSPSPTLLPTFAAYPSPHIQKTRGVQ